MTSFNMTSSYLVANLPTHIIESTYLTNLRSLCPDETHIDILDDVFVPNFDIRSQDDFNRIIRADCYFGFARKEYAAIFRNLERFWREDPNSSPFELSRKDVSDLSNQIIVLFSERRSTIIITCMKLNYIELFDYIVDRDGHGILQEGGIIRVFPLLYYAVMNNNVEITKHGIEMGCLITDDLMKPAVEKNNLEIARILFDSGIPLTYRLEKAVCEFASPEMLALFLEYYTKSILDDENLDKKSIDNLLPYAVYNLRNLKELIRISGEKSRETAFKLLGVCVKNPVNVDVVLFLEEHFGVSMRDLKAENEQTGLRYFNSNYIHTNIVVEDNLGLYMHLYNSGFLVCEELYRTSVHYLCRKITPGLIRKHINQILL